MSTRVLINLKKSGTNILNNVKRCQLGEISVRLLTFAITHSAINKSTDEDCICYTPAGTGFLFRWQRKSS